MSKKLKIKFWKAEKALAMQILEQEGLPKLKEKGRVWIKTHPSIYSFVQLRGSNKSADFDIVPKLFKTNQERDSRIDAITQAITDELFTSNGELKIGDMCEVRDFEYEDWQTRKLLAILPTRKKLPFIAESKCNEDIWQGWAFARPITKRTEPKVEECGELITYTWEEK